MVKIYRYWSQEWASTWYISKESAVKAAQWKYPSMALQAIEDAIEWNYLITK